MELSGDDGHPDTHAEPSHRPPGEAEEPRAEAVKPAIVVPTGEEQAARNRAADPPA